MRTKHMLVMGSAFILIALLGVLTVSAAETGGQSPAYDPALGRMIAGISESEIHRTVSDLQNIPTREYPSAGNRQAGDYLYNRLATIPGLRVEYQGGDYRNIIATLPGTGSGSGETVIVGAHYDDHSVNPAVAPGATDNGGGVAIVLELARVMSANRFDRTIKFAFWNAEETEMDGSAEYVAAASRNSLAIPLYLNYDSSVYDPDNRYVLDLMYNSRSQPFADLMTKYNSLYGIGFGLTYNVHTCGSDHRAFWAAGYPALMTHARTHAPEVHSEADTIGLVSTSYAKKNGQLGMLLVASVANQPGRQASTTTPITASSGGGSFTATPLSAPAGSTVRFTVTPAAGKAVVSAWWSFDAAAHLNTWNALAASPTFFYPSTGTFSPLVKIVYTDGSTETLRKDNYVTVT